MGRMAEGRDEPKLAVHLAEEPSSLENRASIHARGRDRFGQTLIEGRGAPLRWSCLRQPIDGASREAREFRRLPCRRVAAAVTRDQQHLEYSSQ